MKIGRWFKKAVCLLLVWGLILAAAGGTSVSYAQEITVSVDETKLEEQTEKETEEQTKEQAEETGTGTQLETEQAVESEAARQYREVFESLGADVQSLYWQVYESELRARLTQEEYDRLRTYVQEKAVEREEPSVASEADAKETGSRAEAEGEEKTGEEKAAGQQLFAAKAEEAEPDDSGSYQGVSGMHTLGSNVNLATLGRNGKDVWMVTLDGETAFCMDMELLAHSGNTYVRTGTTDDEVIRRAVAYYEITNHTSAGYEYAQLYIWCGGDNSLFVRTMFEYGLSKYDNSLYTAQKLLSMSLLEMNQEINRLDAGFATALGQAYQDIENQNTGGLEDVYVFYGPSGYQRFATLYQGVWKQEGETPEPSAEPEYSSVSARAAADVSYEACVVKTDEETGQGLAGAVFSVYRDGEYQTEVTTGEDGKAVYRHRETLEASSDEVRYCSNYEELDAETQKEIQGCKSEEEARAQAQAQADERLAAMKNSASHTYTLVEVKAREGYYKDPDSGRAEMTVGADGYQEVALTNRPTRGEIRLLKQDLEADASVSQGTASLEGAIYDLYVGDRDIVHPDGKSGTAVYRGRIYESGQWVEREVVLTAGALVASAQIEEGELAFTDLYLGDYVIRERTQRRITVSGTDTYGQTVEETRVLSYAQGYLCDLDEHPVTLAWPGESYELELVTYPGEPLSLSGTVHVTESEGCISGEQVVKSAFRLSKLGASTGQTQAESLAGAGFSVYRVDLLGRADEFEKGENGLYELSSILKAYVNETYSDQEAKYDFSGEEAARAVLYAEEEEVSAYNQSLEEGINGTGDGLVSTGTPGEYVLQELFTNEAGVVQSPLLPYGQYLVVETTVPDDYFVVEPFLVTVNELSPTEIHQPVVCLLDEGFEAYLKVVKTDADTGLSVLRPGASYRIWDLERNSYVRQRVWESGSLERTELFEADENGILILGERLPAGSYRLEEETSPEGFYNAWAAEEKGAVSFEISTGRAYEATGEQTSDGRDVVVIRENYENRETRGQLTIRKQGEILSGYEEGQFVYETVPLAGAVFEVRAAEDITTQDNQKNADGSPALWYEKGQLVAVVTTGEKGEAGEILPSGDNPVTQVIYEGVQGEVSLVLPLGKYVVTEVEAPHGFAVDPESVTVEFVWDGQEQEFVYNTYPESQSPDGEITFTDRRVKTEQKEGSGMLGIGLFKQDVDTGEPVAGAVYGLYTKDNIYDSEGRLILEAGKLLALSGPTDQEGFAGFPVDVPVRAEDWSEDQSEDGAVNSGRYILREEISPDGYLTNPEEIAIEFLYEGQDKEWVFTAGTACDEQTQIRISKRDIAGDEELPGCKLQILEVKKDADGNESEEEVFSWISKTKPETVRGLKLCSEKQETVYILRELQPAEGYTTAEEIRFRLWQTEDAMGEPSVRVEVWASQAEGKTSSGYILVPSAAADGEIADETKEKNPAQAAVSWHVAADVLVVEISPEATKNQLSLVLTEERFAGIDFQQVYVTGEKEKIPEGFFEEICTDKAPEPEESSWAWRQAEDGLVVMYNQKTCGQIEKLDCLTGEPVKGAVLALTNAEGERVEEWTTADSAHEIEGLSPGLYTLTELSAPEKSSYSIMEPIQFIVEDRADTWQLTALEDHIRFTVDKIDGESGESLPGAVLRLAYLGAEGEENEESWTVEFTTQGEPVLFEKMRPGRYQLTELSAPEGYETAAVMDFTVTDSPQTQEFVLENYRAATVYNETVPGPQTPQTGAGTETGDGREALLCGLVILAAGTAVSLAAGLIWNRSKRGRT